MPITVNYIDSQPVTKTQYAEAYALPFNLHIDGYGDNAHAVMAKEIYASVEDYKRGGKPVDMLSIRLSKEFIDEVYALAETDIGRIADTLKTSGNAEVDMATARPVAAAVKVEAIVEETIGEK